MNVVEHLAEIVSALNALQIPHLVMGGHAVRYYGFSRETNDHDLCIPAEAGQNLAELLSKQDFAVCLKKQETKLGSLIDQSEPMMECRFATLVRLGWHFYLPEVKKL
jgi:hypothetical protein